MNTSKTLIQNLREQSQNRLTVKTNVAHLVGIVAKQLDETIYVDVQDMIDKNRREALDGYVYCLSRIVSKSVAWEQIQRAFQDKKEKVPGKYVSLFSQ